ncbi:MAG: phosphatase PAP2 family protein, partial [Anaerolineales bacterium]|nr:phosphatase PAP2 family protein [Anaerolineales bacterium]
LIHVVTAFFASWLLFEIAKATLRNSAKKSIGALFISTLPWILLLASYILTALVFKPAFDYQRPLSYDLVNEPPLVNFFHSIMGAGQAAPSGFVVRQMVLMLTVILLNKHESTPLKKKTVLYAVNTLAVFSVILVGLLRVFVGAHTLFDITFAIGSGAIIFWLIYVIPYSLYNQNGAITTVCVMFLLFVGLFIFYAHNPRYWIFSSFITIGCLLLFDIGPEFLSSLIKKRNPDINLH